MSHICFDVMPLDKVEQLERKTIHFRGQRFDLIKKVVVKNRGGHCRTYSGRGGDQSLRDAGRDGLYGRTGSRRQPLESDYDPNDRSEQPYEGRRVGGSRKPAEVALHSSHFADSGGLQHAAERVYALDAPAFRIDLARDLVITGHKDSRERPGVL